MPAATTSRPSPTVSPSTTSGIRSNAFETSIQVEKRTPWTTTCPLQPGFGTGQRRAAASTNGVAAAQSVTG
jgi:hypothetical protein